MKSAPLSSKIFEISIVDFLLIPKFPKARLIPFNQELVIIPSFNWEG